MVDDALLSAGPHGDGSDEVPPGNETEAEPGRGVAPLVVVAIAVVALAIGFGLGSLRSSSDVDRGASPTTSVVGAPPGASTTTPAAAGTSEPPATAAPADEAPSVPPISAAASFDDAVPTEVGGDPVEGGEGWTTEGGTAVPPDDPLPPSAELPRAPGTAPTLLIRRADPVAVASVRLAQPSPFSGLAIGTEPDGAWELVASPDLAQLRLFQLQDGVPQQRAYADVSVAPGIAIGLYVVDGRLGVVVDGQAITLQTFFGPAATVDAAAIDRSSVSLVVGGRAPRFDDLAVG